jgi:hypothetical protein
MVTSWVGHQQGGRPAAILYPLGHPTPYAYGNFKQLKPKLKTTGRPECKRMNDFPLTPKILVRMHFKERALLYVFYVKISAFWLKRFRNGGQFKLTVRDMSFSNGCNF